MAVVSLAISGGLLFLAQRDISLGTSYAVPVVALVAAVFSRWRERAYFLVLVFFSSAFRRARFFLPSA